MASLYPDTDPFQQGQASSPWFTVANQFLPRNLHDVIRWARYITIQSPTTTEVIRKFATYPITTLLTDSKNDKVKEKYKEVFKSFKLRHSLIDIGFEYFTSGNVFLSIYFPIQRSLICGQCGTAFNVKTNEKHFVFKNWKFSGTCPHCSYKGDYKVHDTKSMSVKDMNLIKWNPLNISVNHNPITGEYEYYYKIPNDIKRRVQMGDTLFVNSLPMEFLEAIRGNQDFKFDNENFFHLKNTSTGAQVEGIAVPPLLSLFGLVYYQATLRKANESIAMEHLNPLRVVFPQAQTANSDPVVAMSLRNFVGNMEDAIKKQKKDKGFVLIAPGPVGYQAIGGEGRNLLVSQEIQQAEEMILLSLGVSRELLSGTTNWTSSTVGLRMLENTLTGYVTQLEEVINWVMGKVSVYLGIETCPVSLEPFKLMDDDSLKQILVSLSQADKASVTTLFETLGLDFTEELTKMKEEKIAIQRNTLETQFELEQVQMLAGKDIGNQINETGGDYKQIMDEAQQQVEQIGSADEGTKRRILHDLKMTNYALFLMTSKLLEEATTANTEQAKQEQAMNQQNNPAAAQEGADQGREEPAQEGQAPELPQQGKSK